MSRGYFILFDPFDTVAFRDGRPFEQDDQGLAETVGVFPPAPPALSGAARVAMAAMIGITAAPGWSHLARELVASEDPVRQEQGAGLTAVLGSRITGPFVVFAHAARQIDENDVYVPCPFSFLFADEPGAVRPIGLLVPTSSADRPGYDLGMLDGRALESQPLGMWRFPDSPWNNPTQAKHVVPAEGIWVRLSDLNRQLMDPTARPRVSAYRRLTEFVASETRIGIGIDKLSAQAKDGQLYAAAHHRAKTTSPGDAMRLAAFVTAAPGLPSIVDKIVPLGGEGRFGRITSAPDFSRASLGGGLGGGVKGGLIVALTPVPLDPASRFGLALPNNDLFSRLACVAYAGPRPLSVGFADQRNSMPGQTRVIRVFPAGATWFVASRDGGDMSALIPSLHAAAWNERLAPADLADLGFGAFAFGGWPQP